MYVSLHILTQHRAGREGSQRHGRGVQQGQQHDGTEHAGALEKKNTTEWGKNGTSGECERPETETVSNRRGVFGTWTQWSISWADGWLTVNQYFKQLQRRNTRAGALGELPQNRKTCSTNKIISVSSLILLGHSIIHRDFYIHSKFDSGCIIFMVCKYKEWNGY